MGWKSMLTLSPTLSLTLNLTLNSQNNYFLESKTCRAPCVIILHPEPFVGTKGEMRNNDHHYVRP